MPPDPLSLAADAARWMGYIVEVARPRIAVEPGGSVRYYSGLFFGVADLLCVLSADARPLDIQRPPVLMVAVSHKPAAPAGFRRLASRIHGVAGAALELWIVRERAISCFDRIGNLIRMLRIVNDAAGERIEVSKPNLAGGNGHAASRLPRR